MPNSSKIAFIFHGEAKAHSTATPLDHLGDDVKKMKTILTPLWDVKKEGLLERSFFSKDSLSSYKAEELDVLFYFTGHGIDYQDGKSIEYSLMLSHDNKQNSTIKELVEDLMTHLSPKTLTIVLDACYSGQATIETDSNKDIQLLSSSNYTQESYESWGVGGGLFTHFFCQAIEGACGEDVTGKITLGDIADNIREPLKNQRQNIVEKTINLGELSNLAIAYNREVLEIKNILKEKFSTREFKSKLFEFLDKDNVGFKKVLATENFDEILWLVLEHYKESIYCIFKELSISNDYIETFLDIRCEKLKEKAQNNREVKKVILRIYQSSKGSIENCWAEGWLLHTIDTMEPIDKLEKIDFSADYITTLSSYLTKVLEKRIREVPFLDLDLIVDDGIFTKGFFALAKMNSFNITTQLLSRNRNEYFFKKNKINTWKTNSEIYDEKKSEKIEDYIFPIVEAYEREDIVICFADNKIVVVSEHNLLTSQYLESIKEWGLPFVLSPCSDIETKVDYKWKSDTMSNLRTKAGIALVKHYNRVNYFEEKEQPLDEEKNIQFIYDNYHDVAKFKEIINEIDEKLKG